MASRILAVAAAFLSLLPLLPFRVHAAPFDPGVTHRPRLILEPEEVEIVRARIDRAPYSAWVASLRSSSNRTPAPLGEYDAVREYNNGNISKAAAFVALMDEDAAAARRAADVLLICEDQIPNLKLNPLLIGDDIHLAEALMLYAQACDLLFASGLLSAVDSTEIDLRVSGLFRSTYNRYVQADPYEYQRTFNNHRSKLAAAVGLGGLCFNQNDKASLWVDWGMVATDEIFRRTVTEDGTYAEGPYYLTYSAVNHLPFAWAYHLFRDGAGGVFIKRTYGPRGNVIATEDVPIENPLTSPLWASMDDWALDIRQPDGLMPALDDANPKGYFGLFGAVARDETAHLWSWYEADVLQLADVADLRADMVCLFDDGVERAVPDHGPTCFLESGGHAILRTSWERSAAQVHLLAEYGKSRVEGGLHEHPDATSFTVYAHESPLAIDSGYIRWEDRLLVNNAENHNLILVDGDGPASPELIPPIGVDAALGFAADTDRLDAAEASANYRNTDVVRLVGLMDERFVAVLDQVVASDGATHDFDWMLHGNGGGTTGGDFSLGAQGARWDQGGGSLVAHVASSRGGAPEISNLEMPHGLAWAKIDTHEVLRARVQADAMAFAALLDLPAAGGGGEALVRDLSRGGEALLLAEWPDGVRALLAARESSATVKLGPLTFEGTRGIFVADPDNRPAAVLVTDSREVFAGRGILLAAEEPLDASLSWGEHEFTAHLENAPASEVRLGVGCSPSEVVGDVIEWTDLGGGVIAVTLTGATADLRAICD